MQLFSELKYSMILSEKGKVCSNLQLIDQEINPYSLVIYLAITRYSQIINRLAN